MKVNLANTLLLCSHYFKPLPNPAKDFKKAMQGNISQHFTLISQVQYERLSKDEQAVLANFVKSIREIYLTDIPVRHESAPPLVAESATGKA